MLPGAHTYCTSPKVILSIDVEVKIISALGVASQGQLRVARELIPDKNAVRITLKTPGIILKRAQIDGVERICSLRPIQGIFERRFAILVSEEEAQPMLGIVRTAAKSTPPESLNPAFT